MTNINASTPRQYHGVMVSSTFTDLKQHRAALIKAIEQQLKARVMEYDSAKPVDVIESSLQMVVDSSVYVAVISHKYGQVPPDAKRNPDNLSITELEFNKALSLNRPILLFIMGDQHPVIKADVEADPQKLQKLNAFRERAKEMGPDSHVHRVYATFESLEEFKDKAFPAIASLELEDPSPPDQQPEGAQAKAAKDPIPTPPAFYSEPRYIGSHSFIGRKSQLETLSDWAAAADPHPVLLFEAIGGAGKSMLTWEWTTKHATEVRGDWAGIFWYSFYEKGAIMADFCRRALAYITGRPLKDFRKMKTLVLSERLLHELQARPWLLILDGLERVLVAYHRIDAAQLADEQAGKTDEIAHRDPCSAIRPEDDDLLRSLAAGAPSKILITSRLIPRVLLNQASQSIPGVLRIPLPGLRPDDAEALLRSCGVTGKSADIQSYLKSHCDCHPLVTGVLAGLINNYLPDRGNFDAWVNDPAGGGQLNLANLDLVQKRNQILDMALAALPEKSRQLLSVLALLAQSVDSLTLRAFNPHLPPEPEKVEKPDDPRNSRGWTVASDEEKERALLGYQSDLELRERYEEVLVARQQTPEFLAAPQELAKSVRDLEHRGLLQYDAQAKHYDLHPVVRGIAAGGLRQEEKEHYGQRVVDHFSQQTHNPYEEAETLDDLRDGIQIVRTLLQMGRYEGAYYVYQDGLSRALNDNLEAYAEGLSILRSFFPHGWTLIPDGVNERATAWLVNEAGLLLSSMGEEEEALVAFSASLLSYLHQGTRFSAACLLNIANTRAKQHQNAKANSYYRLALDIASLTDNDEILFVARLLFFGQLAQLGQLQDAAAMWQLLDPMGRNWSRNVLRPGDAEYRYVQFCFWRGDCSEEHLAGAEHLAKAGRNRRVIRYLHGLRGEWQFDRGHSDLASESLHEAVRMARAVGQTDAKAETLLALAKFHLNQLSDPRQEAERLANGKHTAPHVLAKLWLAIGDTEQAKIHALAAYESAWAEGEPYVYRYSLNKARALVEQLGVEVPNLPAYDPAKDEKLPWEDELVAAIEKLRAENEAEKAAEAAEKEREITARPSDDE